MSRPDINIMPYHEAEHYSTLLKWWRAHDWDGVPQQCLPDTGYVAQVNDEPVAAGFIYLCQDAAMALLDFIVADNETTGRTKLLCIDSVVEALMKLGRSYIGDTGFIYSATANKGIGSVYERHGFQIGEKATTSYFYCFGDLNPDFLKEA